MHFCKDSITAEPTESEKIIKMVGDCVLTALLLSLLCILTFFVVTG